MFTLGELDLGEGGNIMGAIWNKGFVSNSEMGKGGGG